MLTKISVIPIYFEICSEHFIYSIRLKETPFRGVYKEKFIINVHMYLYILSKYLILE